MLISDVTNISKHLKEFLYQVRQKSNPLKLFSAFSVTAWNFGVKFYTNMWLCCLHFTGNNFRGLLFAAPSMWVVFTGFITPASFLLNYVEKFYTMCFYEFPNFVTTFNNFWTNCAICFKFGIKRPLSGRVLGHVTQFLNFGTPNNFWIRFKLGTDIEDGVSLRMDHKTTLSGRDRGHVT